MADKYISFLKDNPQIGKDCDLVDYLWRTNSELFTGHKDLRPRAIRDRKILFLALNELPDSGPTYESACVSITALDTFGREDFYISPGYKKSRKIEIYRFAPLSLEIFDEMLFHQCYRTIPREVFLEGLSNASEQGVIPELTWISSAIFKGLNDENKEKVLEQYKDWSAREEEKPLKIKEAIRNLPREMGREAFELFQKDGGLDFGDSLNAPRYREALNSGVHRMGTASLLLGQSFR
jgi:hypothetical protein